MPGGWESFVAFLSELNITDLEIIEHPAVFTVETMMPHMRYINGIVGKNLFMKDKEKNELWLLSTRATREINLADLSKKVGAPGGLMFADESDMVEKLGVAQGCCTAYALFNDIKEHAVKFILDREFFEGGHYRIYFHPMVNTATMGMKPDDFKKFLNATGHEPILVKLD